MKLMRQTAKKRVPDRDDDGGYFDMGDFSGTATAARGRPESSAVPILCLGPRHQDVFLSMSTI